MGPTRFLTPSGAYDIPHCKVVFGRKFSKYRQKRAQKWQFFGNKRD